MFHQNALTRVLASLLLIAGSECARAENGSLDPKTLAEQVVIHRDDWGVPHIHGQTDAACAFGMAYAQAEDFFWQIEETYIDCLGRAAELHGPSHLEMDVLNRAFEIVPSAKADFPKLEPELRRLFEAFTLGLNHYLASHPEEKPRLLTRFEPWHMLAYCRHLALELGWRFSGLPRKYRPGEQELHRDVGSNAWAIGPGKIKSRHAILFCNPHQPWYGFGQFYEAHVKSDEGWNFTGATFFGHPLPSIGHNEYLGWTFTSSDPNVGSAWIETFDHPTDRLKYRYGDGYRDAVEWKDTVLLKNGSKLQTREYTFQKTHHGPVLKKMGDKKFASARLSRMYDAILSRMLLRLVRATNFEQFRAGIGMLEFPSFHCVYADRGGNIFYLYNGAIPKRDQRFDWFQPVDGSNPATEWKGLLSIDELPQCLNPPSGYVQSCNNSPFTTTDDGNPSLLDFPTYIGEDLNDDKRRAKRSRMLLRSMHDASFEDVRAAAFDVGNYWAITELPGYRRDFAGLKDRNPALYEKVKPYFEHLANWDGQGGMDSTQMTLCHAWYEELYGMGYPAERLKRKYQDEPDQRFQALVDAASALVKMHGNWKLRWGDTHRIQRHANVADFFKIPFSDSKPSLPLAGAPGTMGVIYTQYYTPSIYVPFVREMRKRYGIVGPTYMSVIEFGPRVRAETLIQYGASGRPDSSHFFDQAHLVSERRLKPELFYWEDVEKGTRRKYHPGEETKNAVAAKRS